MADQNQNQESGKKQEKKRVVKDAAFFAAIGRMGGNKTKQRMRNNPNYYSEIGSLGGEQMKKTRGKEFYSAIGKMSKRRKPTDEKNSSETAAESQR